MVWFVDNAGTILALLVLALIVFLALRGKLREGRSCGCGCSQCGCGCNNKRKEGESHEAG